MSVALSTQEMAGVLTPVAAAPGWVGAGCPTARSSRIDTPAGLVAVHWPALRASADRWVALRRLDTTSQGPTTNWERASDGAPSRRGVGVRRAARVAASAIALCLRAFMLNQDLSGPADRFLAHVSHCADLCLPNPRVGFIGAEFDVVSRRGRLCASEEQERNQEDPHECGSSHERVPSE